VPWPARLAAPLLLATLAVLTYRGVPALSYTDIDGAQVIQVNRFDQQGGVRGPFSREVRGDVRPGVRFYRPLTGLTLGIDHALHGPRAAGYHLTDVALHAACAVLLYALLRALGAAVVPALAGAGWFALHPLGIEVVPSLARRGDSLAVALLLLACIGAVRDGRGARLGRVLWMAAGALAPLAKETGFALPLVLAALPGRGRWPSRAAAGVLLLLPALAARWLVLGSLGGYGVLGLWGARALAAVVAAAAVILATRAEGARRALARLGIAWAAGLLLQTTLARGIAAWYLYAPLVGVATVLVALVSRASPIVAGRGVPSPTAGRDIVAGAAGVVAAARGGLAAARGVVASPGWRGGAWRSAAPSIVAVAALVVGLIGSPLWTDYPEWREASRQTDAWIAAVDSLLVQQSALGGAAVEPLLLAGVPSEIRLEPVRRFSTRSANCLQDFSLRAALALRTGRNVPIEVAAYASVKAVGARYTVTVAQARGRLRLCARGPIRLMSPAEAVGLGWDTPVTAARRAHGSGRLRVSHEGDDLLLSGTHGPLWLWEDGKLARAGLP
jgi:hypothetical protein